MISQDAILWGIYLVISHDVYFFTEMAGMIEGTVVDLVHHRSPIPSGGLIKIKLLKCTLGTPKFHLWSS